MAKENITKFDLNAAFKALDEIEIPKAKKGIAANRQDLSEAMKKVCKTDLLLEDYYDVQNPAELEDAAGEREAEIAKAKLARIEKIVDLDAESEEDLLPSYEGKIIIQCPQCMTLFYKNEEDIEVSDEENDIVNISEVCQHCGNSSGYTVIGRVQGIDEAEAANYEAAEDLADSEEIPEEENLDLDSDSDDETEDTAEDLPEMSDTDLEDVSMEGEEVEEEEAVEESFKTASKAAPLTESAKSDINSKLITIFQKSLENWTFEAWESAGAKDKEEIAEDAISELGETVATQDVYDTFWNWAKGLTEADFKTKAQLTEADDISDAEFKNLIDSPEFATKISDSEVRGYLEDLNTELTEGKFADWLSTRKSKTLNKLGADIAAKSSVENEMGDKAKTLSGKAQILADSLDLGSNLCVVAFKKAEVGNNYDNLAEIDNSIQFGTIDKFEQAESAAKDLSKNPKVGNVIIFVTKEESKDPDTAKEKFVAKNGKRNGANTTEQEDVFGVYFAGQSILPKNRTVEARFKQLKDSKVAKVKLDAKTREAGLETAKKEEPPVEDKPAEKTIQYILKQNVGKNLKEVVLEKKSEEEAKEILKIFKQMNKNCKLFKKEGDTETELTEALAKARVFDTHVTQLEELDEESLEKTLTESLTNVYENVSSFKLKECKLTEKSFIVEGIITFKSGKQLKTNYNFTEAYISKHASNKLMLKGSNSLFNESVFKIIGKLENKGSKFITEKVGYKFRNHNIIVEGFTGKPKTIKK